jgi:AbrB family looped-hinge helix DNA binding protein
MATRIRASTKGQIVLPKRTRDRLGIVPGSEIDLIDTAGGVEIRPAKPSSPLSVADAIARLQSIISYDGPRMDEEDWQRGIGQAIQEKWGKCP